MGFRVGVGPRLLRASAGSGGLRVGSGLGPFSVSAGGRGRGRSSASSGGMLVLLIQLMMWAVVAMFVVAAAVAIGAFYVIRALVRYIQRRRAERATPVPHPTLGSPIPPNPWPLPPAQPPRINTPSPAAFHPLPPPSPMPVPMRAPLAPAPPAPGMRGTSGQPATPPPAPLPNPSTLVGQPGPQSAFTTVPATGESAHQKALTRIAASAAAGTLFDAVLAPPGPDGLLAVSIKGLTVGRLGRGNSASWRHLTQDGPRPVSAQLSRGRDGWLVDVVLPATT